MKLLKSNLSEKLIINKYFKKLNFKTKGTFDFENDGAYLDLKDKIHIYVVFSLIHLKMNLTNFH